MKDTTSPKNEWPKFEKLVADHNTKMDLIAKTSERTGISGATLFFAAAFGIYNVIDTPIIEPVQTGTNQPIQLNAIES